MNEYDTAIRMLNEMQLNYKHQFPKEIPDTELVVDLIIKEINDSG